MGLLIYQDIIMELSILQTASSNQAVISYRIVLSDTMSKEDTNLY